MNVPPVIPPESGGKPPVIPPRASPPPPRGKGKWGSMGGIGAFLVYLLSKLSAVGKFLLVGVKFLKLGKILTTSGSMIVSIWFYSLAFGWPLAVGFVILIFIHEMGHVFVAWRQGLPISAPIFLPGMGAIILSKREGDSAWNEAVMGIGGPVGGTIGAIACWLIWKSTGNDLYLALAYIGFFLNLFNLMPMFPLDGGWIVGAISPYLWIGGLIGMVVMFATGWMRNPLILILLLMSLPRIWNGIRTGAPMGRDGLTPATTSQKWIMGLSYVCLAGFLAFAMGETHRDPTKRPGAVAAIHSIDRTRG